jgi:hypothetical protein
MRLGAVEYVTWSPIDLDNAYATAYAAGDSATYTAIGDQIIINEAGGFGWLQNLLGTPYPKFDAIQKSKGEFVGSTAAPDSMSASASNLATSAGGVLANVGSGAVLVMGSAAIIALLIFFRKK